MRFYIGESQRKFANMRRNLEAKYTFKKEPHRNLKESAVIYYSTNRPASYKYTSVEFHQESLPVIKEEF